MSRLEQSSRQISSDAVPESHLAVLLVCVLATTKTQRALVKVNDRDMDIGYITPPHIYRMWGGRFSIEEIEKGLMEIRKQGFMG